MIDLERYAKEKALLDKYHTRYDIAKYATLEEPKPIYTPLAGIHSLAQVLKNQGGVAQQERMARDKRKSFDKALLYSYQGADVRKVVDGQEYPVARALINPNKVKQDYDEKIISIGYEHGFQPGDVFEWVGTGTYWLVYLQELTETAYFRANVRKCQYEIEYKDEDGLQRKTYVALRGPVETRIETLTRMGIGVDVPNFSLNFLVPKTEENLKFFVRYAEFDLSDGIHNLHWRVEGVNSFIQPGIIEVTAVEYYAPIKENTSYESESQMKPLLLKSAKRSGIEIIGDSAIKPLFEYDYYYNGQNQVGYKWFVKEKNLPVEIDRYFDKNGVPHIKIKWTNSYSGSFELCYGTFEDYISKLISIESLY